MPDDFRVSITNAPGKDAYPTESVSRSKEVPSLLSHEQIATNNNIVSAALRKYMEFTLAFGHRRRQ